MLKDIKNNNIKNYFFLISIIFFIVLLLVIVSYVMTDKITSVDNKNIVDVYNRQINTMKEKLKNNPDVAEKKISFKVTSKIVQPLSSISDGFNYTGFMPDEITVPHTMSIEESLNFLDKRYRQLQGDKNWYISNNRVEEYNFNIAGTVNSTREVCNDLFKESPLLANEICF